MRRSPFVALLLGVVLLAAGLLATAGAVAQQRQQDKTLKRDADQVAMAFTSYFERARSLDLLLAQSPAFRPAGNLRGDNAAANPALRYLENLYPGAIGEACLINDQGHEIARVTQGNAAPFASLATNESQNPFFAPTLALAEGQVYQATPYVSPDTKTWVISNSTRIGGPDGRPLLVHFEVALGSFRQYLTTNSESRHVAVVDRNTGRTVLEDHGALPSTVMAAGRPEALANLFPRSSAASALRSGRKSGIFKVDGRRTAASGAARATGNANDWVILEWSTGSASTLSPWAGVAAAAAGIVLILLFLIMLRRQHSALEMAARLDHLTGMANRKALEEALDNAVAAAAAPGGQRVAVLMLDLDGFKQINDTLGHAKGDLVLQEIGRRLHANTFEYDTAARLGGDEFAVVLRQLRELDDVAAVAHRLREAVIRPIEIDGVARFIGVSIGAAVFAEHGRSSEELLRAADSAMYQAKRSREGVRVYDAGTEDGATASWLAAELLIAIENEDVTLVFQPEYSLETRELVGVEALARWHRPGDADMSPSEFIPLAETSGLIRQLTHLTLRKALDEAKVWQTVGSRIPVSVNLSAQLVADRSLVADVRGMLHERGLGGDALVLEVTETAVIADLQVATEVLEALRAIGVRIELDDFGSGYSSFKALHERPLDAIKIARELINDHAPSGQRLLAAIVDIARGLGLKVIAEGIEDTNTLQLVQRLGVDIGQGLLLGRAMSSSAVRLELDRRASV